MFPRERQKKKKKQIEKCWRVTDYHRFHRSAPFEESGKGSENKSVLFPKHKHLGKA
jgi:hypothetical protein